MIRIIKTTNERYATEKLAQLKEAHKAGKGHPVMRTFEDGAGQTYFEVWIDYSDKEVSHV